MEQDIAIKVEGLGKRYQLGATVDFSRNFRETLMMLPNLLWGRKSEKGSGKEFFWALQDVGFEVRRGEALGIIGRNGAGKSTLLKILSRITSPTTGEAEIRGRVGSLLEVGTGFNQELSGRENIYLNGSILGMRKAEIDAQFDEIVAFAGTEQFLDTPVKRYSTGMRVRLGFAVAAHLEPEILVVDEVLSVGDAEFRRKCLGKMKDVAGGGRTVLFVSHNITAVQTLCDRVVWLDGGQVYRIGDAREITEEYLHQADRAQSLEDLPEQIAKLPKDPAFRLINAMVRQDGEPSISVVNGKPIEVEISYEVLEKTTGLRVYFDLCDDNEDILVRSFHDDRAQGAIPVVLPGRYVSRATIPANLLAPRDYHLILRAGIHKYRLLTGDGLRICLTVGKSTGPNDAYAHQIIYAKLLPQIDWSTSEK